MVAVVRRAAARKTTPSNANVDRLSDPAVQANDARDLCLNDIAFLHACESVRWRRVADCESAVSLLTANRHLLGSLHGEHR